MEGVNPVKAIKRILDLIIALTAVVISAPIILGIALPIRLKMGSPVLFARNRTGCRGKPFRMFKFRTMTDAKDEFGNLLPDADRLTGLGNFLRRFSLDELPQLWNIIKGEMSVVGPRPLPVEYLELLTPDQRRRHEMRPGLMSLASVSGRNLCTWERKFELDLYYINNWSLWLDLKIIVSAVPIVILGTGVSEQGHATCSNFTGKERDER